VASKRVDIVIRRPVEDVFSYMDDVAREHEWQPHLIEADQTPPGAAAVGTRRRYVSHFMGRRVENTYVITSYEPRRRVALETTPDSTLTATSEVTWEAVPGGTRVSMSVDGTASGPLRLVPGRMLEATFEKELAASLARLKERLETAG
jgi:uncharacterized membrane protein